MEQSKAELLRLKEQHKKELDMCSKAIRDYIDQYGSKDCDYLMHRQMMVQYHKGAWNALNELERRLAK